MTQVTTKDILSELRTANQTHAQLRPGPRATRQPVHTVYGGAQLFKADLAQKMGRVALRSMDTFAPDAASFASAFGIEDMGLADAVFNRVHQKLEAEPVEDFRIDFEDGFGVRPQDEELLEAERTAVEVAIGLEDDTLPPFLGIRVKPLNLEYAERSLRTTEVFFSTLLERTSGQLPPGFVVTLPKITNQGQVVAATRKLSEIEDRFGLSRNSVGLEFMVETAESIMGTNGSCPLADWVTATAGRCTGAHFGVYDYTAGLDITASHQTMGHPACDYARHVMQVTLAGTGVWLSDGATNILPVASGESPEADQAAVHRAWRLAFDDNMHSLRHAYYQGWDLHPAQLPARYAAVYTFFLGGFQAAATRLKSFIDKAAQASLVGDVFDDAATGQGLLNYFLRAINCGAISEGEARRTGLDLDEIRLRSFARILEQRSPST